MVLCNDDDKQMMISHFAKPQTDETNTCGFQERRG